MRAVYYCRVSTEQEIQLEALGDQIEEAKYCIMSKNWRLIGGYIDEGKSGTTTKHRDEYNRLVADLNIDKFDVIVVKSQDRLMRSAKDWYLFIDTLVRNGKKLYFYLDRSYYEPDNSLITGIKAIMAEEYSRELSKKINNAHRNRQVNGGRPVMTSSTWGYDKIEKQVIINEKEAEIVRLIFELSIQGYGSRLISKTLSNMGIKSRTGKAFSETTVRRILQNELYKGTVVMNKRHKDFNTKKEIKNPKKEWIFHENAVPAIVSPDIWEEANTEFNKRKRTRICKEGENIVSGYHKGKSHFSGKIICGDCGATYWRRKYRVKCGYIAKWMCSEYVTRGKKENRDLKRGKELIHVKGAGCDNINLNENAIIQLLACTAEELFGEKRRGILEMSISILKEVFAQEDADKDTVKLKGKKVKLLKQKSLLIDKLLEDVITDIDYRQKNTQLELELRQVEEKERLLCQKEKTKKDTKIRVEEIENLLKGSGTEIGVFYIIDHLVKIIVFQNYLELYFDFIDSKVPIKVDRNGKEYQNVAAAKYLASIDN